MMQGSSEKAGVLLEALPYIQKFWGKTMIIKYGGAAMQSEQLKNSVMRDVVLLSTVGIRVVLVHGGGPEINSMLDKLGKETVFVGGLRYTDSETMDVVSMVLAGKVNKGLVSHIHRSGGKAIGLCGLDGGMLHVKRRTITDLGFVGDIVSVDPAPIRLALDAGFIPVVATVGVDGAGQTYNVNADTAAAEIAAALKAEKLMLLSDVRGVLADKDDDETLYSQICLRELPELMESGVITGGMIPKIVSCQEAINKGVHEAVVIDGRIEHSILLELFSDSGIGTLLYK